MTFQDHFSSIAQDYAAFRPTYPPALFTWLATQAHGHAQLGFLLPRSIRLMLLFAIYFFMVIFHDSATIVSL